MTNITCEAVLSSSNIDIKMLKVHTHLQNEAKKYLKCRNQQTDNENVYLLRVVKISYQLNPLYYSKIS